MASSDAFDTMKPWFLVTLSTLKTVVKCHWSSVLIPGPYDWLPGPAHEHLGVMFRPHISPLVSGFSVADMAIRQSELIRPAPFGITGPAVFSDFDEAQRLQFTNCWPYGVTANPVLDELIIGDGQSTVIVSAVVGQLDLKAGKDAMGAEAQHFERWRLHHLDRARRELACDAILAARMSVLAHAAPSIRGRDLAQAMLRDCTHRNVAGDGTAVGWPFQAKGGKWPNFSLNLCADQPFLYPRVSATRLSSA